MPRNSFHRNAPEVTTAAPRTGPRRKPEAVSTLGRFGKRLAAKASARCPTPHPHGPLSADESRVSVSSMRAPFLYGFLPAGQRALARRYNVGFNFE
jgi:hypothetical protein